MHSLRLSRHRGTPLTSLHPRNPTDITTPTKEYTQGIFLRQVYVASDFRNSSKWTSPGHTGSDTMALWFIQKKKDIGRLLAKMNSIQFEKTSAPGSSWTLSQSIPSLLCYGRTQTDRHTGEDVSSTAVHPRLSTDGGHEGQHVRPDTLGT